MININLINLYDYTSVPLKDSKPLGISSLNTVLSKYKDINSCIIDFNTLYGNSKLDLYDDIEKNLDDVVKYILKNKPEVVGFSVMYNTFHLAIAISNLIKSIDNSIKIILGGAHVKFLSDKIMNEFDNIDAVIIGEGERVIYKTIVALFSKNCETINGVLIRKDNIVYGNTKEDFIENLDELPIINLDYIDKKYLKSIPLDIGRGCPFSCIFCSTSNFWGNKFRIKSPERIVDEIKYYVERYGTENFGFEHDLFVFKRDIVIKVCKLINENNINITWRCSSRVDTIDEELLKVMSKAGCKRIYFGIETGSSRMQKVIRKNIDISFSNISILIDNLIKYDIEATFSFIYGFPQETEEDLFKTLSLIEKIFLKLYENKKLNNMTFQLHKLIYYPGTKLVDNFYEELKLRDNGNFDGFVNTDKQLSIIGHMINDKDIFIHFYEDKSIIREKFSNLDWLVGNLFKQFIPFAINTYKYLRIFFDNNILKLFEKLEILIKSKNPDELFIYRKRMLLDNIDDMFNIIEELIYKYANNSIIKSVFDFEKTIFNFTYKYSDDTYKVKKYNYDIFEIIKEISFEKNSKETFLLFEKNNKNGKVKNISYEEVCNYEKSFVE